MSRPWGQPSQKASGRGTSAEGCGPAEVFDCGCRYAISEGWAPCALHAKADELRDALKALMVAIVCGGHEQRLDASNPLCVQHARALLERIDRGWRHA